MSLFYHHAGCLFNARGCLSVDWNFCQFLQFGLIGIGFLGSLYIVYRIAKSNHQGKLIWATVAPYTILMVFLGMLNVVLFTLPMAMRM